MAHTVKLLDNEPIITVSLRNPFDYATEPDEMFEEIATRAKKITGHGYVIYDCRDFEITFGDLVDGMAAQSKGTAGSISDDRFTSIIVGSDQMLKMATESFKQDQYGKREVPLYGSMEKALAHARKSEDESV
jgi:hypothetical protein